MKTARLALALILSGSAPAFAQFTAGDLAILRVGDGTTTIGGNAAVVSIMEYSTGGSVVNTFTLPDTGAGAFTVTGNATAEGALSLSYDRTALSFAGYNLARPFASSPAGATSAAAPRAIGNMTYNGTFSIPTTSTTMFSGNGIRSAVTDSANNYWAIANGGGMNYFGNTAAAGNIAPNPANNRVANVVNSTIYFSTGSGAVGIYGFAGGGFPTSLTTTNAILITAGTGTGTASPYDFSFNDSMTVAYVADDRTIANGGGVQKWTWNGSAWVLAYTLSTGANGARGLAVDFSGADPIIFATTTETSNNRLVKITDTGIGSLPTDIATAGVNYVFRGLEFTPVPEPSTFVLAGLGAAALLAFRRRK